MIAYQAGQEPPPDDIEKFVIGARLSRRLLPLQTSRYVLRETRQTLSWLKAYIRCETEDLRTNFLKPNQSFHLVLLEHSGTGDRSVSFRLTNADLEGYTEWLVSFRRVRFQGDADHFLCAEY